MTVGVKAALVFVTLALAALLATVLLPRRGGAEVAHEDRPRESARFEMEEWDQEAAVERARAEESALLRARVGDRPAPDDTIDRMAEAIVELQPWYARRPRAAKRLAMIIFDAAEEHSQDPWIALSMAYKESSFAPGVGRLEVTGGLGEEGYFQIMPRSYPGRTCGRGRSMGNARANADTAMCYLAHVRDLCETDDPWQYVSAYGMRRCPGPGEGQDLRPSKRARRILCKMIGQAECDRRWPSPLSSASAAAPRARAVHPSPGIVVAGVGDP
jgi:hypothetical protein